MIFAQPMWLWWLAALVPMLALEWRGVRRAERGLERLAGRSPALFAQRRPGQRRAGLLLRAVAFALLAVGAADPQWGREVVRRGATGSDVVLVVDVSASMDTRDVAPSRLAEARREALAVLDALEGSRVGVVAFAGDAIRLCPLTSDRAAVRLTLEALASGSVSDPGTDLGRGLRRAAQLMPAGRREEQAVVVWTDGEDLEHGANDAIDEIARTGIRVFAVGVGTSSGDIVPVLDDQGRAVDVKRDESGGPVRSRLDEPLLRNLARRTRGGYFAASRPGGELPRLVGALGTVARAGRGQRLVERPVSRFTVCALLAALLLLLERVRAQRRVEAEPRPKSRERGARAAVAALALVGLGALGAAGPARAQTDWARGDRAFRAGNWVAAESLYAQRLKHGPKRELRTNLATVRARGGKADQALTDLKALAELDDRAGRAAGYNTGTLLGERQQYDDGLAELRRELERDPKDADARWNYEVLLRRREEERKRQQGGGQQNPPPQPQPQPQSGASGASQPQSPLPQAPQPTPQNPGGQPPPTPQGQHMDRAQAEQLLDALAEQARLDQQRRQRVRVMREKRGRDW
jgi:Ca-activated chloride channel family protein